MWGEGGQNFQKSVGGRLCLAKYKFEIVVINLWIFMQNLTP